MEWRTHEQGCINLEVRCLRYNRLTILPMINATRIYLPFREDQFCLCCDQLLERNCVTKVFANCCSYALKGIREGQPSASSGRVKNTIECIVEDAEKWSEICIASVPETREAEEVITCYLCKETPNSQYYEILGKFFCEPCADIVQERIKNKEKTPVLACQYCETQLDSKYVKLSNGKLFCFTCTKVVANRLKEKGVEQIEGEILDAEDESFSDTFLLKINQSGRTSPAIPSSPRSPRGPPMLAQNFRMPNLPSNPQQPDATPQQYSPQQHSPEQPRTERKPHQRHHNASGPLGPQSTSFSSMSLSSSGSSASLPVLPSLPIPTSTEASGTAASNSTNCNDSLAGMHSPPTSSSRIGWKVGKDRPGRDRSLHKSGGSTESGITLGFRDRLTASIEEKKEPLRPDSPTPNNAPTLKFPKRSESTSSQSEVTSMSFSESDTSRSQNNNARRPAFSKKHSKPIRRSDTENRLSVSLKSDTIRMLLPKKERERGSSDAPQNEYYNEQKSEIRSKIGAIKEAEFTATYLQFPSVQIDFSIFPELRDKIVFELYSTERTYLKNMTILFHLWQPIILDNSILFGNLPENRKAKITLESLFKTLGEIINTSTIFITDLVDRLSYWSATQSVSDCFSKMIWPLLKTYSKFPVIYDVLMEYCQKSADKKESNHIKTAILDRVALLSEHPCSGGLTFQSFMIQPIQRITRYVLLLSDFLANTKKSHIDYAKLSEILDELKVVVDDVNEGNRVSFDKVTEYQRDFGIEYEISLPQRNYVKEGDVILYFSGSKNKRRLFLFSDILIIGHRNNVNSHVKYFLIGQLLLTHLLIEDILENTDSSLVQQEVFFAIRLHYVHNAVGETCILSFRNQQEKDAWLHRIRTTSKNFVVRKQIFMKYNTGAEFYESVYTSQPTSIYPSKTHPTIENCVVCSSGFGPGNIKQICKGCGGNICKDCNKNKISDVNGNKVNVCTNCYFKNEENVSRKKSLKKEKSSPF